MGVGLFRIIRESEQINLPANPAEKLISLSLKNISGKLKTSDSLTWTSQNQKGFLILLPK
jgi:hypothetical protein